MAPELTKLGRIRKIVDMKNGGRLNFRDDEHSPWRSVVVDQFTFRGQYTPEDLVKSDFFFAIDLPGDPLENSVEAYRAFLQNGMVGENGWLDYALDLYHSDYGMDYLNETVDEDAMKDCSDVMTRVLSGGRE